VTLRGPDPCRSDTRDANGNRPDNPHRAEVQALCSAIIGTSSSTFDDSPSTFIGDGRTDGGEIEQRSGNVNVRSEEGRTWTFGMVFKSPFEHALARRLTFAVDWYRTQVSGAIAQVGAQTTYDLCFNWDGSSNPNYSLDDPNGMCRRIVRSGVTGDRQYVRSTYANLGTLQTSGVDVQASWIVEPAEVGSPRMPGSLSLELLLNKLLEFKTQSFPTSNVRENKGAFIRDSSVARGMFAYGAFTTFRYTVSAADLSLTWRRLPAVRAASFVTDPSTPFSGAESYSLFNLAASWRTTDVMQLTAGIDNLFDRDPNRVGAGPANNAAGNTEPAIYDVLGRRYYAGVRLTF
jgi:outer membrane receptor protein involved in Fe transport